MSAPQMWADGVNCVVTVSVNFDAESVDLHEAAAEDLYGRFSYGRYGMRAGVWRLLEMLKKQGIAATFFVPALDAENNGRALEAVVSGGHEIAARGYAFEDHSQLGEREAEVLRRAHEVLTRITGRAPAGWRAPGGLLSERTLDHLIDLGYVYDSSFQDDDYPYVMARADGRALVELPQFQMLDDSTLYAARHPHDRVLKTWLEEFDAIYAERGYCNLTLHARGEYGSGRASRVKVVDQFLHTIRRRAGVEIMTCHRLAQWWATRHPQTEPLPA